MNLPSSTHYVEGSLRFSVYTSVHYIIGWCRFVVTVNSPMRVDARSCMNIFGTSDSKYYRRSRCGMSDITFHTATPIGGLSCYRFLLVLEFISVILNFYCVVV